MKHDSGWPMVAPAVVMLGILVVYPGLHVLWISLHRSFPIFGIHHWVGLENFGALLDDPQFWLSLKNTVIFVSLSVGIELTLALPAALALHGLTRGAGWLRVAILVPWAILTVVAARMWEWIYQTRTGILNHFLDMLLGIRPNWIGDPELALLSSILMDIWKTTPFVVLILLAGLATIPGDLYEAAKVDGATPWQVFRHITLPMLRPAIMIAVLFRSIEAFRVFDAIYVLTAGGPAGTSETLSIFAYRNLFSKLDFGYGSAASVMTFVIVLVFCMIYIRMLEKGGEP